MKLEQHEEQVETKNLEKAKVLGIPKACETVTFGSTVLYHIGDTWFNLEEVVDIQFVDAKGEVTDVENEVDELNIRYKGASQDEEYGTDTAQALFALLKTKSH